MSCGSVEEPHKPSQNLQRVLSVALAGIALTIGIIHAFSFRWVNDDAFISFRYARNFIHGLGLVFNAGERVEGYTNFLWTMILAAGMKLGIDPVSLSIVLGIACYAATLLLFIYLSWMFQRESGFGFIIPLTALALCIHRDFNVYATGGLETAFFTFLVSLSFVLLVRGTSRTSIVIAGSVLSCTMMTRPDGIIFLITATLFLLLTRKEKIRSLLFLFAPVMVLFVPYWIWRYEYYGYLFPNTYYAKSASLPYYSQGIKYILLYWKTYYILTLLPIVVVFVMREEQLRAKVTSVLDFFRSPERFHSSGARGFLLAVLSVVFWMLYVFRTGGDFMFARFLIPITPILFFACELLLVRNFRTRTFLVLAFAILLGTFFRFDQFTSSRNCDAISDEWQYYPRAYHAWAQKTGTNLKKYFGDLPIKVAFGGMMAQVVYYAEPQVAIEGITGLTDTFIAHQPLAVRGRPGHEKNVPTEYLINRKVNFLLWMGQPPFDKFQLNQISFDGNQFLILVYENSIMEKLSQYPEVQFVRVPEFVDSYIAAFDTLPRQKIVTDYAFLKTYYFNPNNDRDREQRFLSRLGAMPVAASR